MTDYREIIRLKSLEFSNVAIANSLGCSRNTVSEVLKLSETHSLGWPIPDALTNSDIEHLFYPDRGNNEGRRLPDFEYIYNELAKPGVTLSLLWAEYCTKCDEYSCAVTPQIRQTGNQLSGLAGTAYASLLA